MFMLHAAENMFAARNINRLYGSFLVFKMKNKLTLSIYFQYRPESVKFIYLNEFIKFNCEAIYVIRN